MPQLAAPVTARAHVLAQLGMTHAQAGDALCALMMRVVVDASWRLRGMRGGIGDWDGVGWGTGGTAFGYGISSGRWVLKQNLREAWSGQFERYYFLVEWVGWWKEWKFKNNSEYTWAEKAPTANH